jgi:hypothetical protein
MMVVRLGGENAKLLFLILIFRMRAEFGLALPQFFQVPRLVSRLLDSGSHNSSPLTTNSRAPGNQAETRPSNCTGLFYLRWINARAKIMRNYADFAGINATDCGQMICGGKYYLAGGYE